MNVHDCRTAARILNLEATNPACLSRLSEPRCSSPIELPHAAQNVAGGTRLPAAVWAWAGCCSADGTSILVGTQPGSEKKPNGNANGDCEADAADVRHALHDACQPSRRGPGVMHSPGCCLTPSHPARRDGAEPGGLTGGRSRQVRSTRRRGETRSKASGWRGPCCKREQR